MLIYSDKYARSKIFNYPKYLCFSGLKYRQAINTNVI